MNIGDAGGRSGGHALICGSLPENHAARKNLSARRKTRCRFFLIFLKEMRRVGSLSGVYTIRGMMYGRKGARSDE
jgi:hypothetical protein